MKTTRVRISRDRDYSILSYYKKELERELLNKPPTEEKIEELRKKIKEQENKISNRIKICKAVFNGNYTITNIK
jgi:hypothetical protein